MKNSGNLQSLSKGINRRSVLIGGASLPFLAGVGPAFAQPSDKIPLKFAHAPIIPATNLIIAAQSGFLEQAGIAPNRAVLGTYDVMRAALISGGISVTFMVTDALIRARAAGFDWKMLYPADIYVSDRADAALMVKKGSPIKTAKDLEGKTVMAAPGTISGSVFKSYMRSNGANENSVRLINIPHSQVLAALETGQVDAAHMVDPFMTLGVQKGIVQLLDRHLDQVSKRYLISGYIAKGDWIAANPEVVKRFTAGLKAATDFINSNPDKVLPVLAKETKIDPETLKTFFPNQYNISSAIKKDELQPSIDFLVKNKEISSDVALSDLLAPTFPLEG